MTYLDWADFNLFGHKSDKIDIFPSLRALSQMMSKAAFYIYSPVRQDFQLWDVRDMEMAT